MSDLLKKIAELKKNEDNTKSHLSRSAGNNETVDNDDYEKGGDSGGSKDALEGSKKSGVGTRKPKRSAIVIESAGRTDEVYKNVRLKGTTWDKLNKIKRKTGKHIYEIVEELVDLVDLSAE